MSEPPNEKTAPEPILTVLQKWRAEWDVDAWPDDDPFAEVRDGAGRPAAR